MMRRRKHPCLTAELLEEMAARQKALVRQGDMESYPAPLTRRERFELHLTVFFVGGGSMALTDLVHDPHDLWFWPWVAGWAGLVAVHGGLELFLARRVRRPGDRHRDSGDRQEGRPNSATAFSQPHTGASR